MSKLIMGSRKCPENQKIDRQSGVAAIEFAVGFPVFLLMCFLLVEMSYMSYVSAIGDLMISQTARQSKLYSTSDDYIAQFKNDIDQSGSIWKFLVNENDFRYSIHYVTTYDDLSSIKDACIPDPAKTDNFVTCGVAANAPIAIYRISYDFKPIFGYFGSVKNTFTREMIVVQEYQRSKFKIGS